MSIEVSCIPYIPKKVSFPLFGLQANALLQVLLPFHQVPAVFLIISFLGLSLVWRQLFLDPAVCWECTAGKLKRAGSWKSYWKSGVFKALYGSFRYTASGITCREVDLSMPSHVEYLECCAYKYSNVLQKELNTPLLRKLKGEGQDQHKPEP